MSPCIDEKVLDCNCPLCVIRPMPATFSFQNHGLERPFIPKLRSQGDDYITVRPFASYTSGLNGEKLVCRCGRCEKAALAAAKITFGGNSLRCLKSTGRIYELNSRGKDTNGSDVVENTGPKRDPPLRDMTRRRHESGPQRNVSSRDVNMKQFASAIAARMRRSMKLIANRGRL